jgi:ABC-type nickel/cobalt efflux system permease component RcnA
MVATSLAENGRRRDVVRLALIMGVTHTFGVLILSVVIYSGFKRSTYSVLKYLSFASGLAIAVSGGTLAWQRRLAIMKDKTQSHQELHPHTHEHGHDHTHEHGHHHGHSHFQGDEFDLGSKNSFSGARLAFMGISGGMVPTPSALTIILGTASLGVAWFGVALVISYGVGMSLVLIFSGYTMMKIYERIDEKFHPATRAGRLSKIIPFLAGLFQVGAGIFLVVASRVWQTW